MIDHSVQVDAFGHARPFRSTPSGEFERNEERYSFLRWGQEPVRRFAVVPPDTGIVHQVNLEYLARVVFAEDGEGTARPTPTRSWGTDSHTTMINGLGVLGWGVGGIEAEAAMLGQPMSMLIPQVLGVRLHGELPEGTTATDLVLTVTEMLRERGVVGKFVEFYGAGLAGLPLADRATIGNMSPEFGSTCAIFPVDSETLRYLELSGRTGEQIELVEAYAREQGLWHDEDSRAGLLGDPRARPRGRRPEHRRPQAPAGPRPAHRRAGLLPRGARRLRPDYDERARPPRRASPRATRRPTATTTSRPTAVPATGRGVGGGAVEAAGAASDNARRRQSSSWITGTW